MGRSRLPFPASGLSREASCSRPGYTKKAKAAKGTLSQKELDLDLRHNNLQDVLYWKLVSKYGKENVRTEQPSGVGTKIDVVVRGVEL